MTGIPTVAESMTTWYDFSSAMWIPLIVGYLSRPALIGTVFKTAPFAVTVIV